MGEKSGDKINKYSNGCFSIIFDIASYIMVTLICILSLLSKQNIEITPFDYFLLTFGLLGVIIRYRAYYDLGEFYTYKIGIRENHIIIDTGIYNYLSHPGYSGSLMMIFSFLIFANLDNLFTIGFLATVFDLFAYRMFSEEKMLTEHFGKQYQNFISTRKRIIPFII